MYDSSKSRSAFGLGFTGGFRGFLLDLDFVESPELDLSFAFTTSAAALAISEV